MADNDFVFTISKSGFVLKVQSRLIEASDNTLLLTTALLGKFFFAYRFFSLNIPKSFALAPSFS